MWISGARFWKLVESAAVSAERVTTLTGQIRMHEASIEWLRAHVNRLEHERSIWIQQVYHVPLGSFEIAKETGTKKPDGVVGVPARDEDDDTRLGIIGDHAALLEDVGDEQAGRLGIKHEADGVAIYTK
jgi:hypothetical protein